MTDAYTENQERYDRKLQELIDERNELRAAAPIELGRIAAALERIATVLERVEPIDASPAPNRNCQIMQFYLDRAAASEDVPVTTTCQRCDGCGKIADSDDGEPWTCWTSLPAGSDFAVRTGMVKPIPCPDCGVDLPTKEHNP